MFVEYQIYIIQKDDMYNDIGIDNAIIRDISDFFLAINYYAFIIYHDKENSPIYFIICKIILLH